MGKQDDITVITQTSSSVTSSDMQDDVRVEAVQDDLGQEGDNVKEDKVTGITVTSSGVTIPEVQEGVQEQDVQLGSYMEPFRRAMMSSKTMPQ